MYKFGTATTAIVSIFNGGTSYEAQIFIQKQIQEQTLPKPHGKVNNQTFWQTASLHFNPDINEFPYWHYITIRMTFFHRDILFIR